MCEVRPGLRAQLCFRYVDHLSNEDFEKDVGPAGSRSNMRKSDGGEGGIRTHGTRKGTAVFETARFNQLSHLTARGAPLPDYNIGHDRWSANFAQTLA